MRWAESIDPVDHRGDVLILAGDVCDDLATLERTLSLLASRFARLFYCLGNHELWVRSADRADGVRDSLAKAALVLAACERLGVATTPQRLGDTWVAPLHSWHHSSWDCDPDVPGVPAAGAWTVADYAACAWPPRLPGGAHQGGEALAGWWDFVNEGPAWDEMLASRPRCDVVSFSHFLPRPELLPEKRFLYFPNLAKAAGSAALGRRVAALRPDIHVFGHSHFAWDSTLDGVRYIQAPLCAPAERQRRLRTVCFERFMERAAQDPAAASWLPLEIYRFETPPANLHDATSIPAGSSLQAACEQLSGAGRAAAPPPPAPTPPELTALGEAMHGVAAAATDLDDDPASIASSAAAATAAAAASAAAAAAAARAPARATAAAGPEAMQPLRHGSMVPELGSHWSAHYVLNDRTPWDTTLAPWVAKLYERRRRRHGGGAAAPSR